MEQSTQRRKLRVFFALVPDALTQASIGVLARDMAEDARGRAVADANLHLTLAFVGDVDVERIGMLGEILQALPRHAFVLDLNRVGTFHHSELAWVGPSRVPARLTLLQSQLAAALAQNDFRVDERPFHAHITLAKRCRRKPVNEKRPPLQWRVARVALMASIARDGGVDYHQIAAISLTET